MTGWMKVKSAAAYADVSERTLREWLKCGLRFVKVRGCLRIKPAWIDEYMEQYEAGADLDRVVNDIMRAL